jgi:hypothetical protein
MTETLLRPAPPVTSRPVTQSGTKRSRRRVAWYRTSAVLALLGLLAAITWCSVGTAVAMGHVDDLVRTAIPGVTTVQVAEPGTVVVHHEVPQTVTRSGAGLTLDGIDVRSAVVVGTPAGTATYPSRQAVPATQLGLSVTGPDGRPVALLAPGGGFYYDQHGRLGTQVARFTATSAGSYRVQVADPTTAGARIAAGADVTREISSVTWQALTIGLVTLGAAALIGALAFLRRP